MQVICVTSLLHHHFTKDGAKAQGAGASWPISKVRMAEPGRSLDSLNLKSMPCSSLSSRYLFGEP